MSLISPGATIGILGGGQLGRMTAMAARSLGYHIHALDPDASCASRFVVDKLHVAKFDDVGAARALAAEVSVATIEIENIAEESLRAVAQRVPLRPGVEMLTVIQDRVQQKQWLAHHGFAVGPHRICANEDELGAAVDSLGAVFAKSARGGYDGRSQAQVGGRDQARAAWAALGSCVAEKALALDQEVSVLVARRPSGEIAVYPPAVNHHQNRILAWSSLPGELSPRLTTRAGEIARAIAEKFSLEGLLVVELFVVGGDLLVNELAPRPHNSFHSSEVACATSQFEQLVRAICDLPLGAVDIVRPAAIYNLLGDLWQSGDPPFARALEVPSVRLHLYGKRVARPGRKMGHLSASGSTPQEALARVLEAAKRLTVHTG